MKTHLLMGGAALVVLVVLAPASLSWIPSDRIGVVEEGGRVTALSPGLHFRLPFTGGPVTYPGTLGPVAGAAPLRTSDGTLLQAAYQVGGRLDAGRLEDFHEVASQFGIDHVLRQGAAHGIAAAAATRPSSDLASGQLDGPAREEAARLLVQVGVTEVVLSLRVEEPRSILDLARALAPEGRAALVRPMAEAALAGGGTWEAFTALGLAREADRDLRGAESAYLDALSIQPSAVPPMAELVRIYTAVGEHSRLQRLLSAALEAGPDSVPHLNWLGGLHMKRGELQEAESAFARALEIDGSSSVILNNLGGVYLMRGRGDEAVETFRRAVTAAPADRQSLFNLGVALSSRGDHEEALEYLLRAEQADPGRKAVLEAVAAAYRGLGRRAEAERWRRRALESGAEERPSGP